MPIRVMHAPIRPGSGEGTLGKDFGRERLVTSTRTGKVTIPGIRETGFPRPAGENGRRGPALRLQADFFLVLEARMLRASTDMEKNMEK